MVFDPYFSYQCLFHWKCNWKRDNIFSNIKNKRTFQKNLLIGLLGADLLSRERNLLESSNMETFETLFKLLALKLTLKIFSTNWLLGNIYINLWELFKLLGNLDAIVLWYNVQIRHMSSLTSKNTSCAFQDLVFFSIYLTLVEIFYCIYSAT